MTCPVSEIQLRMRDQGADPGDQPAANATIDPSEETDR